MKGKVLNLPDVNDIPTLVGAGGAGNLKTKVGGIVEAFDTGMGLGDGITNASKTTMEALSRKEDPDTTIIAKKETEIETYVRSNGVTTIGGVINRKITISSSKVDSVNKASEAAESNAEARIQQIHKRKLDSLRNINND